MRGAFREKRNRHIRSNFIQVAAAQFAYPLEPRLEREALPMAIDEGGSASCDGRALGPADACSVDFIYCEDSDDARRGSASLERDGDDPPKMRRARAPPRTTRESERKRS